MALNISELDALRKKLDRDRRELEERERALAKVEQMLREEMQSGNVGLATIIQTPEPPAKVDGFTDGVRMAVAGLSGSEFGVHDVERFLVNVGMEMPKSDPRSRIAMVLQMMRDKGEIIRTHTGKGRDPHRYRATKEKPR